MLAYVTNEEKTEDTLVTGLNCSTKYSDAYEDMKFNFEMYSGERFFKKSIKSDTAKRERQKIRLHHYIQSFKPGEVTPEEAHQIGVEWAEKVFGKKHMVLCATHTDRGHIHNHFAVCPYDMYGKHWYANKKSMRMCRAISDEIALAHGLEIIEHPKKSYCHKYGEYKARKEGRSWKQKLCDDIDNAIMKDNVRSVDDLLKELMRQGYGIKRGKYISIKVKQNRKPIRSFRLGDGYALEHLEYRINHKNYEMPLSEAMKYSGIQREYALCIRQIQIQLYRCPEPDRLHIATYREVERSSRLLFYLQEKQIHSAEDFQKAVAAADERAEDLKNQKEELVQKISDTEKMIEEIPQYLEILNRRPLMPNDIKERTKKNFATICLKYNKKEKCCPKGQTLLRKSLFILFFFVQAVKLRIIFVKLLHNEPLNFGGDGNPTHLTPSFVVLEFFHSDTGGNGVHILLIPFTGITLLFFRYRHIITLSTCVSMY